MWSSERRSPVGGGGRLSDVREEMREKGQGEAESPTQTRRDIILRR